MESPRRRSLEAAATLALLALLLQPACAAAPVRPQSLTPGDYGYAKAYGSWLIRKEMAKNDAQGLSIALVDDQRIVWAEGFGFADQGAKVPAGPDTIYRAGSVSKLFTVTAALQLAEQGKLGLDRPVSDYIPGFALRSRFPDAPPITIRSLMTHHSGIPSDHLKGMWTDTPDPISALPVRLRDEYVAFPPDTVFSYSNLGVSLLGVAVQNVSGRDFCDHMRKAVLDPLGMERSSFAQGIDRSPLAARAYKGDQEATDPPLRDVPAGGLNSSVSDLSRFVRMVLGDGSVDGRQVLRPESVREMLRPQNAGVPLDLDFRVGLGWMLSGLGGIDLKGAGVVAHHGGATMYHRARLIVLPEAKLGVVVLTNTRTAGNVATRVAIDVLKVALETKTGVRQPERKPENTGPFLPEEELQSYAGEYASLAGFVRIRTAGDHLSAKVMNRSFRLAARPDGKLQPQYRLLGIFPVDLGEYGAFGLRKKTVAGRDVLALSAGEREMLVAERVTPVPIPDAWRRRAGRYEFVNAGSDVRLYDKVSLRVGDGLLLVEYALPEYGDIRMTHVLRPVSDDDAVFAGLWRGMGETVRAVRGEDGERLMYSGYALKRVPDDPPPTGSP